MCRDFLCFVVCGLDVWQETDVTLKALHQYNLGRDKILRQVCGVTIAFASAFTRFAHKSHSHSHSHSHSRLDLLSGSHSHSHLHCTSLLPPNSTRNQIADGSSKIVKWVKGCPGPYLCEWLRENGSKLGALGKGVGTGGGASTGQKRKINQVDGSHDTANGKDKASGGGGGSGSGSGDTQKQRPALNRFHPVDPKEDAYTKDL